MNFPATAAIRQGNPNHTMSFRVFDDLHQLIHDAAEAKGVSAANGMRRVVAEWAAGVMGVEVPDLTIYEHVDVVAAAAKKFNMSSRELTAFAVREFAKSVLSSDGTIPFVPKDGQAIAAAQSPSVPPTQPRRRKLHRKP
jgi:hypothetical protein